MLTMEMAVTIHVLKNQGKSIKAIARELRVSRNTVRKYLGQDIATPCYARKAVRPGKLDPYKAYLQARMAAASPDWIPAAVLYEEILEQGYTGKIRILSNYLSTFRPTPKEDPLVRFETAPGEQLQVDFTVIRRGQNALKAFVATLGYSRASYVRFYDHERTDAWVDGLRHAFDFFGGVPREVLFDNAKTIMIERDAYAEGEHRWNPQLLLLARECGFKPRVCRPYRARTKGKVERFNRYLKHSFVTPLRATLITSGLDLDVKTANGQIGRWLTQTANARVHGTTSAIPNERLVQEQAHLLPLPITNGSIQASRSIIQVPTPYESLQHPLATYDLVLGGPYELTV